MGASAVKLIESWNLCCDDLETAILEKNYTKFKYIFRKGSKCFDDIIVAISNNKDEFIEISQEIKKVVDNWQKLVAIIEPWMNEIKETAEREGIKKTNKIKMNKVYGSVKQAGKNLRIRVE